MNKKAIKQAYEEAHLFNMWYKPGDTLSVLHEYGGEQATLAQPCFVLGDYAVVSLIEHSTCLPIHRIDCSF